MCHPAPQADREVGRGRAVHWGAAGFGIPDSHADLLPLRDVRLQLRKGAWSPARARQARGEAGASLRACPDPTDLRSELFPRGELLTCLSSERHLHLLSARRWFSPTTRCLKTPGEAAGGRTQAGRLCGAGGGQRPAAALSQRVFALWPRPRSESPWPVPSGDREAGTGGCPAPADLARCHGNHRACSSAAGSAGTCTAPSPVTRSNRI